jgi:hypothetical protein
MVNHFVMLKNILGWKDSDNKFSVPHKILFGKFPLNLVQRLVIWGSPCYPITDIYSNKFTMRTRKCVWVGISETHLGALVYNPLLNEVFVAGMLKIHEITDSNKKLLALPDFTEADLLDDFVVKSYILDPKADCVLIKRFMRIAGHRSYLDKDSGIVYAILEVQTMVSNGTFPVFMHTLLSSADEHYLKVVEYLTENDDGVDLPVFALVNMSKNGFTEECIVCSYDVTVRDKYQVFTESGKTFQVSEKFIEEFSVKPKLFYSMAGLVRTDAFSFTSPKNRTEMLKRHDSADFIKAETVEMLNIIVDMECFDRMSKDRPEGFRIHTSKMVYKIKFMADGTYDKHKARWTIRGFTFLFLQDFLAWHAPVCSLLSLKLFFITSLNDNLIVEQWDVKSAYLIPELDTEDVWVQFPEGVEYKGKKYGRMRRNIYGTPQSAELFYGMFSQILMEAKCVRSSAEPTLFIYRTDSILMRILIHVDNLHVASNNTNFVSNFMKNLHKDIKISKESSTSVLGVNVVREAPNLFRFDMKFYILNMCEEYDVPSDVSKYDVAISPAVIARGKALKQIKNPNVNKAIKYMNLVMGLFWVARNYRYDILFACIFYASHSHCYNEELYKDALKTLYYLKNTVDTTLDFELLKRGKLDIRLDCDASFGDFPVFCTMVYINNCLVHMEVNRNKSESIVDTETVTSSTHSEMGAIFLTAKLGVSVYKILFEMGDVTLPVIICNDGKSALFNLENFVTNKRTLHLDVKYRYVTELKKKGFLELLHKGATVMWADIGTKALGPGAFLPVVKQILNFKIASLKGAKRNTRLMPRNTD